MTGDRPTPTPTAPTGAPATATAAPGATVPRAARSAAGTALTVAGIAVAGALLVAGVLELLSWVFVQTASGSATVARTDTVELVADGRVTVTVGDVDEVRIERDARYAWAAPRYGVTAAGDRTVVRHECTSLVAMNCSADLTVEVPDGTRVVVRTSDGAVRVAGAAGGVQVRAADGDVQVTGTRGDVDVRGLDGAVDLADVTGDVVVHVADGGLRVTDVTGDVLVRGGDGATVVAGAGSVDVRTADGRLEVRDVRGPVTARSADGAVLVAAVDGDVSVHAVDGDVTVHGNGEPVALDITSNGRQRVEGPTDPAADVRVELRTSDGAVSYLGPQG